MSIHCTWSSLLALTLILSGCSGESKKSDEEAEPATPVKTAQVTRQTIRRTVTADASLFPVAQSSVTSKISAPVRRFLVNRGDRVRAGQLLAELEDRDLLAAVAESRALYSQAETQFEIASRGTVPEDLAKSQSDLRNAEEALNVARKQATNRATLVREGALAQKLADDANVSLAAAQAQYDTAKRHLETLQNVGRSGQIKSAKDQVDAARARLSSMEAQVGYAEVRSPISGFVSDRPINAGEMISTGTPLLTIVDVSHIVAHAAVPMSDVQYLRIGDPARIVAGTTEALGKVTVISPAVNLASTTLEIWISAPNPGEKLKAGSTAKIMVETRPVANAIVVPAGALLAGEDGATQVLIVQSDSKAHQQHVDTGIRQDSLVQITSGLQGGESVIVSGGLGLAEGAKVKMDSASKE